MKLLLIHVNNRSILKIKFNNFEKPIFVTNNHRFLVLDSTYPGGKLHKWKEIQDCTKNDLFVTTIHCEESSKAYHIWNGLLYNAEIIDGKHIMRIKKNFRNIFEETISEMEQLPVYEEETCNYFLYHFHLESDQLSSQAKGSDPDIIVASAKAYINALNRLIFKQSKSIMNNSSEIKIGGV